MPKKRRRKSAKRVARGKKLARNLPRDRKGKFLPRGSKNLFRKGKRRRSVPSKKRRTPKKRAKFTSRKLARRKSAPAMATRGRRGVKTTDFFPNFITGTVLQSGADTFNSVKVFTPIPRLKTVGNRATVMELLWLDIEADISLVLTKYASFLMPCNRRIFS